MPAPVAASDLARHLADLCGRHAIDLAGAAPLDGPAPHADRWRDWLDRDLHGGLDYLTRTREERADPRRRNPWARSILVFAQRYADGWPPGAPPSAEAPWLDGVARYAHGLDYHDVLLKAVRAVLRDLAAVWPDLEAHPAVDTGPYLERDWAERAGLGWVGRNTCLIHETLGSGLVLAVAPTNLELTGLDTAPAPLHSVVPRPPAPRPGTDRCGSCTRCLDACPTGAIIAPRVLDAGRCISTWTIEWQGRTPAGDRDRQAGRLFGCDVCQAVCPWNGRAFRGRDERTAPPAAYEPLAAHAGITLRELLTIDPDTFRARFRRTPLWRAHPDGLRRDALVVAGCSGRTDCLDEIRRLATGDPDPEIREVAAWAAARLEERP